MSHRQVCAKGIGTDYGIHIPWPQRRSWPGGGAGAPGRKMVGLGVVSLSIVRLVGGALCAGGARRESQTADCEPTSVFSHYSTIEIYNTSAQWRQVCRGRRRGGAAQPVRVHIYRPMIPVPPGRAGRNGECPTRNRTPSTRRRTGYVHSTLVKRTNQTPRGAGEDPS